MNATDTASSGTERWEFNVGDRIREKHEPHAPGGIPIGKTEYVVERRLQNVDEDERCYHVETEEGGKHLYVAGAIEGLFEVVDS